MDAVQIRALGPRLDRFLAFFDDCFPRRDTRTHLPIYVRGLLSDLPRKSVEPIALAAGLPPRTLQQFLSLLAWDEHRLIDRLQQRVARAYASPHSVGIVDETGCPKKGDRTPGVQRQYCGATGKIDNCVVTVHLAYAADDFHCLLDGALYLPEAWANNRPRCQAAGIPDTVAYRPKWQIALELLDRARTNGAGVAWLTFDEGYGGKPEFLRALGRRQQRYVAEVPRTFRGWLRPPRLVRRPRALRPERPAAGVADLARDGLRWRDQPWQRFRIKDGHKGPIVWEAKRVRFFPVTEDGDPGGPVDLVVARNVLDVREIKYFVSNAPPGTPLGTLLKVAFARWRVERCFEDEKTELGFDHYEGRTYQGLLRHQALAALSHLFLAEVREEERGEKPGVDRVPSTDGVVGGGAVVVVGETGRETAAGKDRANDSTPTTAERQGAAKPPQKNHPATPGNRHSARRLEAVSLGYGSNLAL